MKAKTLGHVTHVSARQAAAMIGVSVSTAQRWCKSGAIAASRGMPRGRYLIDVAAMRARAVSQ